MNILHHKSWHVRNKNNIQRVERDEQKAADEEKEKQRKIAVAEQEARTELLRSRARHSLTGSETKAETGELTGEAEEKEKDDRITRYGREGLSSDLFTATGHMNFFKETEEGGGSSGKNIDHEAEKKAEQEKWEKSVGILTYLGQSAIESQSTQPWYLNSRKRKKCEEEDTYIDTKTKKHRDALDPLNDMKTYLHKKKHKHTEKDKKHKHKDTYREKKAKDKDERKTASSQRTVEQLRAERLKREATERQKSEALLAKLRGDKPAEAVTEVSERDRGYNSVYNREFIRQPKKRRHYDN